MGDDDKTITFSLEPMTDGYPVVVDTAFLAAVAKAITGGGETQAYFDAVNATADFWGLLARKAITFAPGQDPQGRPVMMASSGNVELRIQGVFTGDQPTGEHPPFGIVTIDTRNTTSDAAAGMAVAARLATMPGFLPLTADLFKKLVVPLYENMKTFVSNTASALSEATSVEGGSIDALSASKEILEDQSLVIEDVEDLVDEGIDYLALEWGAIGLDVAGLAPLMAIPMLVEFLGHEMSHSLIVQNMSDVDFTFELTQIWGRPTFEPGVDKLPKLETVSDPLAPGKNVKHSYSANYHFVNTTNLGPIGYVLTLQPSDNSPATRLLVWIPWAGDNAIWVGPADGSIRALWDKQSTPNGKLVVTTESGGRRITLSLSALRDKTEGAFFYCSMALIEQL